jgi:hypothetical protein
VRIKRIKRNYYQHRKRNHTEKQCEHWLTQVDAKEAQRCRVWSGAPHAQAEGKQPVTKCNEHKCCAHYTQGQQKEQQKEQKEQW